MLNMVVVQQVYESAHLKECKGNLSDQRKSLLEDSSFTCELDPIRAGGFSETDKESVLLEEKGRLLCFLLL